MLPLFDPLDLNRCALAHGAFRLAGSGALRFNQVNRLSGHPVFKFQARHPLEVPRVVGHQGQVERQCMRCDLVSFAKNEIIDSYE